MDDSLPPISMEDEDTLAIGPDDVVSEPNVLAKVKFPSKARKSSFHCFLQVRLTPHDFFLRTKVDLAKSCRIT
jgi:hypothetical protein